jgi:hypothetical protein
MQIIVEYTSFVSFQLKLLYVCCQNSINPGATYDFLMIFLKCVLSSDYACDGVRTM